MDDFIQRVQGLPLELFEEIKTLGFTCDPSTVKIDRDYKPPTILQISSATRATVSQQYYARTIAFRANDALCLTKWLTSLNEQDVGRVSYVELNIVVVVDRNKATETYPNMAARYVLKYNQPRVDSLDCAEKRLKAPISTQLAKLNISIGARLRAEEFTYDPPPRLSNKRWVNEAKDVLNATVWDLKGSEVMMVDTCDTASSDSI